MQQLFVDVARLPNPLGGIAGSAKSSPSWKRRAAGGADKKLPAKYAKKYSGGLPHVRGERLAFPATRQIISGAMPPLSNYR
jgi:hypothetical protein